MNETTNTTVTETVTEVKALSREEIQAVTLTELRARTVATGCKTTEARLLMEQAEAMPEERTADAFTNQVLLKIEKVSDYQDSLIDEARALKAYANVLEYFDGVSRIKLIKDLRACAANRLKTKRELEAKNDALRAFIYGQKGSK